MEKPISKLKGISIIVIFSLVSIFLAFSAPNASADDAHSLAAQSYTANIIGSNADGWIGFESYGSWGDTRNAAIGTYSDKTSPSNTIVVAGNSTGYGDTVYRSFLYFDTSSIPANAVITSANLTFYAGNIYIYPDQYPFPNIISVEVQRGTQAQSFTLNDFGAFSGSEYAHKEVDYNFNTLPFNSQGINDIIKGGITKLVLREYQHDYLNQDPGKIGNYQFTIDSAENSDLTHRPVLTISYSIPPADGVPPTIDYGSGTEADNSLILGRNNIFVNVTANDVSGINSIKIFLYNATGQLSMQTSGISPLSYDFAGLADGTYYFNATATDIFNNMNSLPTRTVFINTGQTSQPGNETLPPEQNNSINISIPFIGGNLTNINASDVNTYLSINTSLDISANITITKSSSAPNIDSVGMPALGQFITIDAPLLEGNLNNATITLYYNKNDVASKGIDESSLRLWYYNSTSGIWSKFDGARGGVDTSKGFVYAITNHLSIWGIFGNSLPIPPATGTGGGGGGGSSYYNTAGITNQNSTVNLINISNNANASVSSNETNKNGNETIQNETPLGSKITGAIISAVRSTTGLVAIAFIVGVIASYFVANFLRKDSEFPKQE